MLGRLRGKSPPPAAVLDRLDTINPLFRVGWLPSHGDHAECWGLYLDQRWWVLREMAYQRLRLYQRPEYAAAVDAQLWWDLEAQLDGHSLVAEFPDDVFGTEAFFNHLQRAERLRAPRMAAIAAQDRERQRLRAIAGSRHLLRDGVQSAAAEQVMEALQRLMPEEFEEAGALGREFAPYARNRVQFHQPERMTA